MILKLWCKGTNKRECYNGINAEPLTSKKLMFSAHADEVGMMITYIDNNGFIYFQEIGGIDTNLLPGQKVEIHNHQGIVHGVIGKKPIHLQD